MHFFCFCEKILYIALYLGVIMSYITIDESKCKSCYLCIFACPKKVIKKSQKIGKTGENIVEFFDENNECIACKSCAMICPDIAIVDVVKE